MLRSPPSAPRRSCAQTLSPSQVPVWSQLSRQVPEPRKVPPAAVKLPSHVTVKSPPAPVPLVTRCALPLRLPSLLSYSFDAEDSFPAVTRAEMGKQGTNRETRNLPRP